MNAVLGMSELLLQADLSDQQFRYVKDIKVSAEALLEIINDILDVSKIQSGKLSLKPVHYDFDMIIDSISSIAHFVVEDKEITFDLDIQGELPGCLYGDDVRLRQVLLNLLGNAFKFTKAGYVRLTVKATDTSLLFTVKDTGIGIREEDIGKLFGAFEQFDAHRNRDNKGTGLGLSITKSLVDMMGGSISVQSVYGQGSSFHVEVPKVIGDESLMRSAEGNDAAVYAPDARILIVDDNKINLNVARGLLTLCGIAAETASSGQKAIDLVKKNQYDIVFMDQMMPEMDGLETTGILREMGIKSPIIALTANAVSGASELMIAAGMDDYLSKPIIQPQLKRVLLKWLPAEKLMDSPSEVYQPDGNDSFSNENENDNAYADADAEFWEKIGQIEWLSLSEGLSRVEGQRRVYESTLRLMMKEIEKSDRNLNDFLDAGDMRGFYIEVHGLKGSLANIGAAELSDMAYKLETASGNNDKDFCVYNLPSLLLGLSDLWRLLEEAFSSTGDCTGEIEIPSELPPILESLTDALRNESIIAIDEHIQMLTALSPTGALGNKIEQIADAVIMADYDSALGILQDLTDISNCA